MPETLKKSRDMSANKKVTPVTDEKEVEMIMTRGVADIVPRELFEKKLRSGEQMRIYLGVDPTGPAVHIGHAVILRKLRQLQDLGHEIIFLIGDFTARIGDPTGKDAARVALTHEDVLANAASYKEQVAKILDFEGENPAQIKFNAEWLDKLNFQDVMELAANFTVQQMLERDMFANRMKDGKPIYVHEFFYPMMQGYDSVAMEVDGEVGGSDQLFNMLTGRTLLKSLKQKEKFVMTFELLEGTDGRKMSKSYKNIIGVMDEPNDMFGKVMSVDDELILRYFELVTDATAADLEGHEYTLKKGGNPRDSKVCLARQIVKMYHSEEAANEAEKAFFAQFADKERPEDIPVHVASATEVNVVELVVEVGFASSKSDARRLVEQGGVKVNDEKVTDVNAIITIEENEVAEVDTPAGTVLQVGKRKFVELKK